MHRIKWNIQVSLAVYGDKTIGVNKSSLKGDYFMLDMNYIADQVCNPSTNLNPSIF